ncbi:MAG: hypothetical protein ABJN26_25455 [Stappiaceae bacterium]
MMDIVQSILQTDFTRFCVIVGSFIFLFGATQGGITMKFLKNPKMGATGSWACLLAGAVLLIAPVVSAFFGTAIGLAGQAQSPYLFEKLKSSNLFIGSAFAAPSNETLIIQQRHAITIPGTNSRFAIYIGDVHLTSASNITLFVNKSTYSNFVDQDLQVRESELKQLVNPGDIIDQFRMTSEDTKTVTVGGKQITLRLSQVNWNLIGSDSVRVQFSSR